MAGNVASAGVTMDERIANLMKERGHEHLLMKVDDPALEVKAGAALEILRINAAEVIDASRRTVAKNLRTMAGMGKRLVEYVGSRYPRFEPSRKLRTWEDYLPPLGPDLHALLEDHSQTFGTQQPFSAIGHMTHASV
jgi:hypothetical protein